jgi:phosphate transport system substrate-binding protein
MEEACKTFPEIEAVKSDKQAHDAACKSMREDGAFVEAGENDNLMVQRLGTNPELHAIFGFSFLDQNSDRIQGSKVGGVEPTFENIAAGSYGVSRSLFIYVKNAHVGMVAGIKEFVAEYTSDKALGQDGYLAAKGLIPLPDAERKKVREQALALKPFTL